MSKMHKPDVCAGICLCASSELVCTIDLCFFLDYMVTCPFASVAVLLRFWVARWNSRRLSPEIPLRRTGEGLRAGGLKHILLGLVAWPLLDGWMFDPMCCGFGDEIVFFSVCSEKINSHMLQLRSHSCTLMFTLSRTWKCLTHTIVCFRSSTKGVPPTERGLLTLDLLLPRMLRRSTFPRTWRGDCARPPRASWLLAPRGVIPCMSRSTGSEKIREISPPQKSNRDEHTPRLQQHWSL